jgi:hypothetical protein
MSSYAATARIDKVAPRLVMGRVGATDVDAWALPAFESDDPIIDVAAVAIDDPLVERLIAVQERWSQLTFYLFDAEGWR